MENDKRRVKLYQPVILFSAFTSVRGVFSRMRWTGVREQRSEGAKETFSWGWRANRSTVAITLELETRCKIDSGVCGMCGMRIGCGSV